MGTRVYTSAFDTITIAAVQDIFYLRASVNKGIELHHIMLSAGGVTAAAEIRLRLRRLPASVTAGSGGSVAAMSPVDSGDTLAATAVVHTNDTTQATSSGTILTLCAWQWNVLGMFEHLPVPEDRERIAAATNSEALVLDIGATPASTVVSGFIKWAELT